MEDFRLTKQQIDALKVLHKAQRDRRFAYRVNAIILLGTGWSAAAVAEALLVDTTTIYNWLAIYQQGGTGCKLPDRHRNVGIILAVRFDK